MTAKLSVGVLMGGISPEHPVSLVSGTGMLKNLDQTRYQGFPILISKENIWCWPDLSLLHTAADWDAVLHQVDSAASAAATIQSPPQGWHVASFPDFKVFPYCDLMLIGLHGVGGEDGRLQGFFELAGQKYTGSNSLGSALAMDKITAKRIYQASGIPTAKYRVLEQQEYETARLLLEKEFAYPMVVKSPQGGSSIGIGIAKNGAELTTLISDLGSSNERLLVEEFIRGREGTCGVLANYKPLPPSEIRPDQDEFFNFEAKYKPGRTQEITPAEFPEAILKQIQDLALRCHQALQLSVYSRTDFIYAQDQLYILETNNLPGFTPTSLLPQAAACMGLSYQDLLTKIIEESLKK